jgi:hypothetical protein
MSALDFSAIEEEEKEDECHQRLKLNGQLQIYGLQVRASLYIQMNQPTRCSSFSGLLLV